MNVVDSSGWLSYFADDEGAVFFAASIEKVGELVVPTISIYEVFKRVSQQRGVNDALQAAALMEQGTVVSLDSTLALAAAHLSVQTKLPMADSIILATARAHRATLWTQDADFEGFSDVRLFRRRGDPA